MFFFGTTNNYEFLKDTTGNRRFYPLDVNPKKATKDLWKSLDEPEVAQIWAETVQLYKKGGKSYIIDDDVKALAKAEQDKHLEESPLAGDIREYLSKLLPANWASYDLTARRQYLHGSDFGDTPVGEITRYKVCIMEIWCECFNGDKKDLNRQKSNEIKEVILKTGDWEQGKSTSRFSDIYAIQKGFIKKSCKPI